MSLLSRMLGWRPDKYWLAEARQNTEYTPDIAALQLSKFQLLFVVDEMKQGFDQYPVIAENSAFESRAFTMRKFNFYVKRVGEDKTYIPLEANEPSSFVKNCMISGELHAVESELFMKLDKIKQNGVQFVRKRVKVLVPHREMPLSEYRDTRGKQLPLALRGKKGVISPERIHIIEAWMYVGIPEYWHDLLDGGFLFEPVWISTAFQEKKWLTQYYNVVKPYEKPKRHNR